MIVILLDLLFIFSVVGLTALFQYLILSYLERHQDEDVEEEEDYVVTKDGEMIPYDEDTQE